LTKIKSDKKPIIQGYIGISGSGKTYKGLQDIKPYKRQIRIDAQPHGQKELQDGCEVIRDVRELNNFVADQGDGDFKACLWPENLSLFEAFHWVCSIAITHRNIALFADEANRYIGRKLTNAQEAVFFQSRHSQTRLFYTLFNPRTLSPHMRGNTIKLHLFQSFEENFTSYLKAAGASPEVMQQYASEGLPQYSYALIERGQKPRIISPQKGGAGPSKKPRGRRQAGK